MIKKIAWDTFKNTGDVNTFLELKQFQGIEEQLQNNNMEQKAEKYGDNKNKWDNTCVLYTSPSPRDTERGGLPSSA